MTSKSYLAEFIGTFALLFIGIGSIAADSMTGGKLGLTGIALAHGLTIAVMVSALGHVSGAHFNPAVTIGAWSAGKITSQNAVAYIVAQCLGALTGSLAIGWSVPAMTLTSVSIGTPSLGAGIGPGQAVVAEIVLTFFLMLVIYGTAIDSRGPKAVAGLCIGLVIVADIFMGAPISGAAMNPARHFGPAIIGGGMSNWWVYWVGPVLGSVVAAQVYKRVLEKN